MVGCKKGGGKGGKGGGVATGWSSEVSLIDNTIISNTAAYSTTGLWDGQGGGVYGYNNLKMHNNVVSGNVAARKGAGRGGGIYCNALSSPTITRCTIAENFSWQGGGLYAGVNCSPTLERTIIDALLYKNFFWWGLDLIADGLVLIWVAGAWYILATMITGRRLFMANVARAALLDGARHIILNPVFPSRIFSGKSI